MTEEMETLVAPTVPDSGISDLGISVEPLATPYRVILNVADAWAQEKFDSFWAAHGEALVKTSGYKGKKLKGGGVNLAKARESLEKTYGLSMLYKDVLTDLVGSAVDQKYGDVKQRVMLINELRYRPGKESQHTLVASFYFWPKLLFASELNFSLANPVPVTEESEFEKRCLDLQHKHRRFEERFENDITEDVEVLVDIITSIEGVAFPEGTIRGAWYHVGEIESPELRLELLKHERGDLFDAKLIAPEKLKQSGKTLSAMVKIWDTRSVKYLELDDEELYKLEGFESKMACQTQFSGEFAGYKRQAEKHAAFNYVIEQLVLNSKIEPVPQRWVEVNVENYLSRFYSGHKGDKAKALKSINAANEDQAKGMIQSQVMRETINELAIHCYADMFGLERDAEAVALDIAKKMTWTSATPA